jgi:hypothetical protein
MELGDRALPLTRTGWTYAFLPPLMPSPTSAGSGWRKKGNYDVEYGAELPGTVTQNRLQRDEKLTIRRSSAHIPERHHQLIHADNPSLLPDICSCDHKVDSVERCEAPAAVVLPCN